MGTWMMDSVAEWYATLASAYPTNIVVDGRTYRFDGRVHAHQVGLDGGAWAPLPTPLALSSPAADGPRHLVLPG